MKQYRILENRFYEKGEVIKKKYHIQERKRFLFVTYWKSFSEISVPSGHSYPIYFDNYETAEKIAKKCVLGKEKFTGWETEVIG